MKRLAMVDWERTIWTLDHAFQPIARFSDGTAYGYEALLRGWEEVGFSDIQEVFDTAFEEGSLYALDLALRKKAFAKFARAGLGNSKLFYNLDTRLLLMPDYATGNSIKIARDVGLTPSRIVFEISELFDPERSTDFDRVVSAYKDQGFRIALDDFGSGYAGLKLLHRASPDIVKIDRYFVAGVETDPRKAAFLEKIAAMAQLMGISVVAEGVETEEERAICMRAGCDFVQGYLVARPTRVCGELSLQYEAATEPSLPRPEERRMATRRGDVGQSQLASIQAVDEGIDLPSLLSRFRKEPDISLIPVVDGQGEPVGVFRERDFREYVYSPYGISLLAHLAEDEGPASLLVRAPILPLGASLAKVITAFGASPEAGCVLLTDSGLYAGLILADRILALVAERDLVEARDQNPLSRLPGNLRIAEICGERLNEPGSGMAFAYYDFDNFKPFNDSYGFRSGDRVIMLFADILRSTFTWPRDFIGHLGGDDFFASIASENLEEAIAVFEAPIRRFAREVTSFYSREDRERGWLPGKMRSGEDGRIGLLTASLAVAFVLPGSGLDAEGLSELLAKLKKTAKGSSDHMAVQVVGLASNRDRKPRGNARHSPSRAATLFAMRPFEAS